MTTDKSVRVRFAPSPTGHLHIGGLRTALFNWLFARHHGGAFLLRIEDTDRERSTQEYRDSILHSFAWTQLEHDEEIVTQSERVQDHRDQAQRLIDEGKAYRCFCTPEEVVARYESLNTDNAFISYDGYCKDRAFVAADDKRSYAIRFNVPRDQENITFNDIIKGPISFAVNQIEDFVIIRSDGSPMYNFVVVVDDAFMRITHIIRGEEHIVNTPKQILLYRACGYNVPSFAHLPLILGPSGEKLSKRDGATSVVEYAKEGYLPHALLNYLARLGWAHGDQEIFSLSELVQYFSLEAIGNKGAIFDFEKLAWVNSSYIKLMDAEQLLEYILNTINPHIIAQCSNWNIKTLTSAIDLYKDRVKTLKSLASEIMIVHNGPAEINPDDKAQWLTAENKKNIKNILGTLVALSEDEYTHEKVSSALKNLATSLGIKVIQLLQPIRLALIGKSSGPGVFDLLVVVGKKESIVRLESLHANL